MGAPLFTWLLWMGILGVSGSFLQIISLAFLAFGVYCKRNLKRNVEVRNSMQGTMPYSVFILLLFFLNLEKPYFYCRLLFCFLGPVPSTKWLTNLPMEESQHFIWLHWMAILKLSNYFWILELLFVKQLWKMGLLLILWVTVLTYFSSFDTVGKFVWTLFAKLDLKLDACNCDRFWNISVQQLKFCQSCRSNVNCKRK